VGHALAHLALYMTEKLQWKLEIEYEGQTCSLGGACSFLQQSETQGEGENAPDTTALALTDV
jgi:hypothetical protein